MATVQGLHEEIAALRTVNQAAEHRELEERLRSLEGGLGAVLN
jgi:hypothetical protein